MRQLRLLLILAICGLVVSCVEEESSLTTPGFAPEIPGESPSYRNVVDASELHGAQFGMAQITLKLPGRNDYSMGMPSCYLSVLQAECGDDTECRAKLDEDSSSLVFENNFLENPGDDHKGIKFTPLANELGTGMHADFLRDYVLPLLAGADWTVERANDGYYLTCTDCPIERNGTTYQDRVIHLALR